MNGDDIGWLIIDIFCAIIVFMLILLMCNLACCHSRGYDGKDLLSGENNDKTLSLLPIKK